jgi:hypothetical protein
MTPFVRVTRDATLAMLQRQELLAKPSEFFRDFFCGRVPTLQEKLFWIEDAVARMTVHQVFENDLYAVQMDSAPPFIHLTITRHDGAPCKEWSHLQRIKNELIGPEHEAVELFPAESRLVDAVDQYHLWVHADPSFRFPLGFQTRRFVLDKPVKTVSTDSTFAAPSRTMTPQVATR